MRGQEERPPRALRGRARQGPRRLQVCVLPQEHRSWEGASYAPHPPSCESPWPPVGPLSGAWAINCRPRSPCGLALAGKLSAGPGTSRESLFPGAKPLRQNVPPPPPPAEAWEGSPLLTRSSGGRVGGASSHLGVRRGAVGPLDEEGTLLGTEPSAFQTPPSMELWPLKRQPAGPAASPYAQHVGRAAPEGREGWCGVCMCPSEGFYLRSPQNGHSGHHLLPETERPKATA